MQALLSTSGKGSLEDVCDGKLETEAIETRTKQTDPKKQKLEKLGAE